MSAFLKFTDPDDETPVFVRASAVEAVVVIPAERTATFGFHDESAPEDGYTKLVLSSGGKAHVAESAEDVVADLVRSGR